MAKKRVRRIIKKAHAIRKMIQPKLHLNTFKFALAGGILMGLLMLATAFMSSQGYAIIWTEMFAQIYGPFGYNATTFLGIMLGVIYGFLDGFILTGLFAIIYNKIL